MREVILPPHADDFNPCPSYEGRLSTRRPKPYMRHFNPRPSYEGRPLDIVLPQLSDTALCSGGKNLNELELYVKPSGNSNAVIKVRRNRVSPDCLRFAPHGCHLQRKEALWVITLLGAHLSNPALIIIAQVIEPQAVHTFIYSRYQFIPEFNQSSCVYITLEDGILNALSIRYTDSGYFSKSLLSCAGCCIHIVCNNHQHKTPPLLPQERWVAVNISPNILGNKLCLHYRHKTPWHLLA